MFVEIISLFVDDQGSLYLILSTLSALQTSIIASSPVSVEMGVCLYGALLASASQTKQKRIEHGPVVKIFIFPKLYSFTDD